MKMIKLLSFAVITSTVFLTGCVTTASNSNQLDETRGLAEGEFCYRLYRFAYADLVENNDVRKGGYKSVTDGETVTFTNFDSSVKINSTYKTVHAASKDGSLIFSKITDENGIAAYYHGIASPRDSFYAKYGCLKGYLVGTAELMEGLKQNNML